MLCVGVGDRLYEFLVLGRPLAREFGRGDRRLDMAEHLGQVAELRLIDRALDRAAFAMAEDDNRLGAGELAREFEAADDVGINEIAGDACREDRSQALIEHQLGRHAAVDAANDRGKRCLTLRGLPHLLHQIAVDGLARRKALIAFLQQTQGVLRRGGLLAARSEDRTSVLCLRSARRRQG